MLCLPCAIVQLTHGLNDLKMPAFWCYSQNIKCPNFFGIHLYISWCHETIKYVLHTIKVNQREFKNVCNNYGNYSLCIFNSEWLSLSVMVLYLDTLIVHQHNSFWNVLLCCFILFGCLLHFTDPRPNLFETCCSYQIRNEYICLPKQYFVLGFNS